LAAVPGVGPAAAVWRKESTNCSTSVYPRSNCAWTACGGRSRWERIAAVLLVALSPPG
jgi:hypothetical protein